MIDELTLENGVSANFSQPNDTSKTHTDTEKKRPRDSAFARFYQRYFSKLTRDLRRAYGAGPPDPEDVAQRTFEKIHAHGNITEIENIENFAWTCARNIILSEKRAAKTRQTHQGELEHRLLSSDCDERSPERVFIGKEKLDIVMETLKQLPERRRRIFVLNRVHHLTPEQAGKQCGVSRTAAVRHIANATLAIANALELDSNDGGSQL